MSRPRNVNSQSPQPEAKPEALTIGFPILARSVRREGFHSSLKRDLAYNQ